jgi:hypothetical protein
MSSYQIPCLSNRKKSNLYAMCLKDGNSVLHFLVTEGGGEEDRPLQGLGSLTQEGTEYIGDMFRILLNSVRVPGLRWSVRNAAGR